MIGNVLMGIRKRSWTAFCAGLLGCVTAQTAPAADCPGHPDALGTSRTLVVDPREHPKIGTMQYAETLPLADHEVVLTFDDGPLPKNSNQILEILASQCVKATFFTVGRQANANPEGVRKVRDAGHTVATHTQNHPANMHRLPIDRARQEIEDGIASVTAALGDGTAPAPFFRIPGLARAEAIEEYAASRGIQLWSADFPADDWRHVSASRVYDLAIQRLEAKGKGILLLHDIQARTVAALPKILHELKARGYRIVHVVPATPEQPATPTEPQQWQLHPASEMVAISRWPKIPNFVFAGTGTFAAPALADLDWHDAELADPERHARGVPLPREAPWPRYAQLALDNAAAALSVPGESIFEIKDRPWLSWNSPARHSRPAASAERENDRRAKVISADASGSRRATGRKPRAGRAGQAIASHLPPRGPRHATHAGRRALKRVVQVRKGNA